MPAPILFPTGLDALLSERKDGNALRQTALRTYRLPFALYLRRLRWVVRMECRIAQVSA